MPRRLPMIRTGSEMKEEVRTQMRGGTGEITIRHLACDEETAHCRLFAHITIPPGSSIGPHSHSGETEYYYILSGSGLVSEDTGEKHVSAGDLVITGGGASHSIANTASDPLQFMAVILLD